VAEASTTQVSKELGLPTNTVRRILEDLTAYGLIERRPQGQGKADHWARLPWEGPAVSKADHRLHKTSSSEEEEI
jgi:predicted ArsR family transcriptional regulator